MSTFSIRLKEARRESGLSQERLGILAGIDESSASARINQYERGKHAPDFQMVERIAQVLNVPEAYFYAKDDDMAQLLKNYHRKRENTRKKILEFTLELESKI